MNYIDSIEVFYDSIEEIIKKMEHKKYCYLDLISFIQISANGKNEVVNQIYWRELFFKFHFCCTASLLRTHKWIEGIYTGIKLKNNFLFTSSLRGFLESWGDSTYSLADRIFELDANFQDLYDALHGKLISKKLISETFENFLDHFENAKMDNTVNGVKVDLYKPLSAKKYIDELEVYELDDLYEIYSELCEYTHPASDSINCFKVKTEIDEHIVNTFSNIIENANISSESECITTTIHNDEILINDTLNKYGDKIIKLITASLSIPVNGICMLNEYDVNDLKSNYINNCLFIKFIKNTEGWKNFKTKSELIKNLNK